MDKMLSGTVALTSKPEITYCRNKFLSGIITITVSKGIITFGGILINSLTSGKSLIANKQM